jgi:ribosomal protein S18 acetylase RimI-like enzyme
MARWPEQAAASEVGAEARVTFRRMSEDAEPKREIPAAVQWVDEASQPFFDWVMGDRSLALQTLERWMHRPSSEVSIERVVLLEDTRPVGGFVALSATALARCRRADALAAALAAPPDQRSLLIQRFGVGRALFPEVHPDALYLSRMGVLPAARGQGRGRAIVRHFLELGMRQGLRRFALDVWSGNVGALELYRSFGFRATGENHAPQAGLTYVRMDWQGAPAALRNGSSADAT